MYKYLDNINSPKDLKKLSIDELKILSKEIREEIINVVSKTGGHLAPSLGAVELILSLHYVFDAPKDKIIFDVGHQAYAHKLITGRRKLFHTLRQYGGISGFTSMIESEYDSFGTGHAGTAISSALGMAVARDLNNEDFKVIAVVGDGALTCGESYEGLNQAGYLKKDIIIVLNDNGMSISENVGSLSQYLNKIIRSPEYLEFKSDVWNLLGRLPKNLSSRSRALAKKLKSCIKSFLVPTIIFEELGFRYIGPLNGHDIKSLIENFSYVKKLKGPIFVHVLTEKGKGYLPAEKYPEKYHGISGETKTKCPTYSEVFSTSLVELATYDKRIIGITAAMPDGTGLSKLRDTFPLQFFDVGICEQHAITFACGLALQGFRPICAIYSTFLQRGVDQLIHDVCLQKIPVLFLIDRAGIVGEDGPTHHGIFDLSYLRLMPNIVISAPKDGNELRNLLYTGINYTSGPFAIRYPRSECPDDKKFEGFKKIEIGKWEILKEVNGCVILATGSMVYPSISAVKDMAVGVVNARFIKPLDEEMLIKFKNKKIITIEENVITGGFGSSILEFYNSMGESPKILMLGLPDEFIPHGSRDILLEKYGLTEKSIRERIKSFI